MVKSIREHVLPPIERCWHGIKRKLSGILGTASFVLAMGTEIQDTWFPAAKHLVAIGIASSGVICFAVGNVKGRERQLRVTCLAGALISVTLAGIAFEQQFHVISSSEEASRSSSVINMFFSNALPSAVESATADTAPLETPLIPAPPITQSIDTDQQPSPTSVDQDSRAQSGSDGGVAVHSGDVDGESSTPPKAVASGPAESSTASRGDTIQTGAPTTSTTPVTPQPSTTAPSPTSATTGTDQSEASGSDPGEGTPSTPQDVPGAATGSVPAPP